MHDTIWNYIEGQTASWWSSIPPFTPTLCWPADSGLLCGPGTLPLNQAAWGRVRALCFFGLWGWGAWAGILWAWLLSATGSVPGHPGYAYWCSFWDLCLFAVQVAATGRLVSLSLLRGLDAGFHWSAFFWWHFLNQISYKVSDSPLLIWERSRACPHTCLDMSTYNMCVHAHTLVVLMY